MHRCAVAIALLLATVGDALAQKAVDPEISSTYGKLLTRLDRAARQHFQADQARWLANRSRTCTGERSDIERCLSTRDRDRLVSLKALLRGPYPFVSEQALMESGKVGAIDYVVDARYPQFDGKRADFTALNGRFEQSVRERAREVVPDREMNHPYAQTWRYLQWFRLQRPSARAIAVELDDYSFSGGAHGNGGTIGLLIDLQSGRIAEPASVFAPGEEWLWTVAEIATPELKRQLIERTASTGDLLAGTIFGMLRADPGHLLFRNDALAVHFNRYDIAAYAFGEFTVEIPYDRLRHLMRPDGLLSR
jgi:hypothetical protein